MFSWNTLLHRRRFPLAAVFIIGIAWVGSPEPGQAAPSAGDSAVGEPAGADASRKKQPLPLREASIAAEDKKLSLPDTVVVTSVRVIFRHTVELVDLDVVKQRMIEKLQEKNQKSYEKTMNSVFDDLEYLQVKDTLGLTRNSSKRETLRTLRRTKPETVVQRVEEISDKRIAEWINKELTEKGLESLSEIRDYIHERVEKFVAEFTG